MSPCFVFYTFVFVLLNLLTVVILISLLVFLLFFYNDDTGMAAVKIQRRWRMYGVQSKALEIVRALRREKANPFKPLHSAHEVRGVFVAVVFFVSFCLLLFIPKVGILSSGPTFDEFLGNVLSLSTHHFFLCALCSGFVDDASADQDVVQYFWCQSRHARELLSVPVRLEYLFILSSLLVWSSAWIRFSCFISRWYDSCVKQSTFTYCAMAVLS